jgi:hypothetical protein
MGIQINGNTDTIAAIDGALTVSGAELAGTSNINVAGIITATGFVGNLTGNVNSIGVSTFASGSASAPSISATGDSNTGIFFPSADTIAFAEGGIEALRINSNANIGIGTDNPYGKTHIEINAVAGAGSGNATALWLRNSNQTSNNSATIFAGNNSSQASAAINFIHKNYSTNEGEISFDTRTNSSTYAERVRLDSSGNVNITNGNLVIGTSGKGIDFSATANSSGTMTSELLADYEEGTWDCRPTTSTSSIVLPSGISSLTFNGTYVKIGSMVYLTGYFETSQTSADTSIVYLRLPFAVNGTSNMWSSTGTETSLWSFPSGVTYITVRPESGQSHASFKGCGTGIVRVDMTANRIFASVGMYWIGVMMYRTA